MDWKGFGVHLREQGTLLEGTTQLHSPDHHGEPKNVISTGLLSCHPQALGEPSVTVFSRSHLILTFYIAATHNPALQRGDVVQRNGDRSQVNTKTAALTHH